MAGGCGTDSALAVSVGCESMQEKTQQIGKAERTRRNAQGRGTQGAGGEDESFMPPCVFAVNVKVSMDANANMNANISVRNSSKKEHGMSGMTLFQPNDVPAVVPQARCELRVREATPNDLPFIDSLQKMHSHMVGWMPMKQLEKYVADGNILVAEEVGGQDQKTRGQAEDSISSSPGSSSLGSSSHCSSATLVGYCMARDQYMKRDDVGIIYQLNVLPLRQRHLVGASLVKAVFEKAAYGCRLFCCWCAQDIQANYFWESIGFVPLAFRTGSRAKQRIHIFWQRRVRDDDTTTPYWFPSQTQGGAVAEDRLVLPIPPGTHWRDAKPVLLPGLPGKDESMLPEAEQAKALPGGAPVRPRQAHQQADVPRVSRAQAAAIVRSKSKHLGGVPAGKAAVITRGGVKYIDRADAPLLEEDVAIAQEEQKKRKARPRKPRMKHDQKYVAAARELRDRYLEQVNHDPASMLPPGACGKYDVSRQLDAAAAASATVSAQQQLPASQRQQQLLQLPAPASSSQLEASPQSSSSAPSSSSHLEAA